MIRSYKYNIGGLENSDWPKATWDMQATNVEDLREELKQLGISEEHFKTLPAYTLALESGNYPWLELL